MGTNDYDPSHIRIQLIEDVLPSQKMEEDFFATILTHRSIFTPQFDLGERGDFFQRG